MLSSSSVKVSLPKTVAFFLTELLRLRVVRLRSYALCLLMFYYLVTSFFLGLLTFVYNHKALDVLMTLATHLYKLKLDFRRTSLI